MEDKDRKVTEIAIETVKLIAEAFEDDERFAEINFASNIFRESGEYYRTINFTIPLGKR